LNGKEACRASGTRMSWKGKGKPAPTGANAMKIPELVKKT